jgi:hypothetical protein
MRRLLPALQFVLLALEDQAPLFLRRALHWT